MSSMEIEHIIAQRVTNAIEAITIYEARTRVTRDSMDQVARQGVKLPGARFVLGKVEEGSGGVGEWWRWAVEWERGGAGVGRKTGRWCYSTFKKDVGDDGYCLDFGSFTHKPLPLIEDQGRQVVPADYFINNDLKYLKGGSSSSKYATSTTRTKAAKYDNIEGIEDMVPKLWSPVKVAYNKHVVWGTYHYCLKQQRFYAYACHWKSLHDVYSKRRIIALGVESYQKKLNITRPETTRCNIFKLTPYTAYKKLQGIIYQVKYRRNRLMRSDELYKFCDRTLSSVRRVLHDIASNLDMDYLPKRYWSNMEMKRSCVMVKAIEKLLFERRLMRNLEKFDGGCDYGNDLRLLERTI
nr:hypothetical protein [Tanacetum cinerariifolium]